MTAARVRDHRGRPGRDGGGGARRRARPRTVSSTSRTARAARSIARSSAPAMRARRFGADYLAGRQLASRVARQRRRNTAPATTVWHIDPPKTMLRLLLASADGIEHAAARRMLLATGAIERPVPIPGWTLPGVMTAGAAQILLKTADASRKAAPCWPDKDRCSISRPATGPGRRSAAGGARNDAALATIALPLGTSGVVVRPPRCSPRASALIARSAPRRRSAHARRQRAARATGAAGSSGSPGTAARSPPIICLLHEGVIPNTQISLALQLAHRWDDAQLCWRPVVDDWGRTSLPNIAIAGDGARHCRGGGSGPVRPACRARCRRRARPDRRGRAGPPRRGASAPSVATRAGAAAVSRRAIPAVCLGAGAGR